MKKDDGLVLGGCVLFGTSFVGGLQRNEARNRVLSDLQALRMARVLRREQAHPSTVQRTSDLYCGKLF